jgi:glycosyltransferase involved in cell wall biosynthesis
VIALIHGAAAYGAVERYVETIARALGDDAVLIHPGVPAFERLGVRTVPLLEPTVPRLVAVLRRLRPETVHVTDVWPQALVAARMAGVRRVFVTDHTPELPRRDNVVGKAWRRLGWATRPEVVYTSEADRARHGRGRGQVVPLGIDVERFANAKPALAHTGRIIGTVGRLTEQKGQRTLLAAVPAVLERFPDARFVLVGDGELRRELELLARGLPVELTGFRDDVPALLASFDVFACPSRFEGLCVAVLEAQAAGIPVVATPVGGMRDTVVPGETGTVVPVDDAAGLAAAIVWVLDNPPAATALAAEAKRRVGERFTERRMIDDTLRLYEA